MVPRVNTFLELKMENERLQQRVAHLRAQAKALNVIYPTSSSTSSSNSGVQFSQHVPQSSGDSFFTAYDETPASTSQGQDKYNDADDDGSDPSGSRKKVYTSSFLFDMCYCSSHIIQAKRAVNSPEQHVCQTCGRTDSPEWRKVSPGHVGTVWWLICEYAQGPDGPKTLCNACGLRWAKKLRTDKSGETVSDGNNLIF